MVVLAQSLLECLGSLPGIVVRNLGADVVSNVSLGNTVQDVRSNGSQPLSVNGAESTSREGPAVGLVMRQQRVGVLQVGDHDQPVVDPEVRDTIVSHHGTERSLRDGVGNGAESEGNSNVGHQDLRSVSLVKDDGLWIEVVGALGVVQLTRRILEEVHGPSEELLNQEVEEVVGWSVFEDFSKPFTKRLFLVSRGSGLLLLEGGLDDFLVFDVGRVESSGLQGQ